MPSFHNATEERFGMFILILANALIISMKEEMYAWIFLSVQEDKSSLTSAVSALRIMCGMVSCAHILLALEGKSGLDQIVYALLDSILTVACVLNASTGKHGVQ